VKPLDLEGGIKFILSRWQFSTPNTEAYLKKIIPKHVTCGLYQDGELATVVIMNAHGLAGILITDEKHKRKGYAFICMQYLLKELAKKGFIPASSVQQENSYSVALHKKLGMKITHESDYIYHTRMIKRN